MLTRCDRAGFGAGRLPGTVPRSRHHAVALCIDVHIDVRFTTYRPNRAVGATGSGGDGRRVPQAQLIE